MRDPIRWRDANGGADAETRSLLSSDSGIAPSQDEAKRIWAGLETQLHLAPGPGLVPQPAVPTAGAGGLAGKITLAVVLASAVGAGLYRWRSQGRHGSTDAAEMAAPSTNPPRTRAVAAGQGAVAVPTQHAIAAADSPGTAVAAAEHVPSPAEPALGRLSAPPLTAAATSTGRAGRLRRAGPVRADSGDGPPRRSVSAASAIRRAPDTEGEAELLASSWGPSPWPAPTPATTDGSGPRVQSSGPPEEAPVPVNVLLQDSRQLERARAALRAHNPDRALALLKVGAFRTTSLAQEREALTIEAMAAKPALRAKAAARARAFMTAYPRSPYRARIRAIALAGE